MKPSHSTHIVIEILIKVNPKKDSELHNDISSRLYKLVSGMELLGLSFDTPRDNKIIFTGCINCSPLYITETLVSTLNTLGNSMFRVKITSSCNDITTAGELHM